MNNAINTYRIYATKCGQFVQMAYPTRTAQARAHVRLMVEGWSVQVVAS
jgi:hypothetical protein